MSIQPRDSASLDVVALWDQGYVQRRIDELTQAFMTTLEFDDQRKLREEHFKEQLKQKKPLPPPQWHILSQGERQDLYFEKARTLAEEILEQERKIYVDSRAERDKAMIIEIARKLKYMVYVVNEKSEPEKLKITVERVTQQNYKGESETCDIMYCGDHDVQRLYQIWVLKQRLVELKDFYPYYSEEVKAIYDQAMELASLEIVRKEG